MARIKDQRGYLWNPPRGRTRNWTILGWMITWYYVGRKSLIIHLQGAKRVLSVSVNWAIRRYMK